MTYVTEILHARHEDNKLQAKAYRQYLMALEEKLLAETSETAKQGMLDARQDIFYEYEALSKENREIEETLQLIKNRHVVKRQKRAPRLASERLGSNGFVSVPRSL